MKMFYLVDGNKYVGPLDFEELKYRKITKNTPIWFEGIKRWTEAGKLEVVQDIIRDEKPVSEIYNPEVEYDYDHRATANALGMMGILVLAIISLWVFIGL